MKRNIPLNFSIDPSKPPKPPKNKPIKARVVTGKRNDEGFIEDIIGDKKFVMETDKGIPPILGMYIDIIPVRTPPINPDKRPLAVATVGLLLRPTYIPAPRADNMAA